MIAAFRNSTIQIVRTLRDDYCIDCVDLCGPNCWENTYCHNNAIKLYCRSCYKGDHCAREKALVAVAHCEANEALTPTVKLREFSSMTATEITGRQGTNDMAGKLANFPSNTFSMVSTMQQ